MDRAFLFEMQLSFSIEEIASITKPENRTGRSAEQIRKISSLQDARPGDLSFLSNLKYRKQVESSEASLVFVPADFKGEPRDNQVRSEEHTSELQSRGHLVCRLLLEKKKNKR